MQLMQNIYRQTYNRVVIVLVIGDQLISDINSVLNQKPERNENWENKGCCKLNFLNSIKRLMSIGINTRLIIYIRSYSLLNSQIQNLIQSEFNDNQNVECEFATSSGDLWFLLAKNIQKFDIINILSNKNQRVPDSVLKYLQSNKATSKLKFIKTKNSLENYDRSVEQISNELTLDFETNRNLFKGHKQAFENQQQLKIENLN